LVGHSMGGLLVSLYARAYPDEVAGLAFVDAVGRDYAQQFPPDRYRAFRTHLDRLLRLADWTAPLGLPQCFNQPANIVATRLPPGQRDSALARSFSARSYRSLRLENEGFDQVLQQARELGPLPAVPTIVLSSECMRDFPPGLEDETMRKAWRRNQLSIAEEAQVQPVVMAGSGHYLHIDKPAAVIHELNAWRDQVRIRRMLS
jgi:pimeloyl-ACP methyl ester carboxylesterase